MLLGIHWTSNYRFYIGMDMRWHIAPVNTHSIAPCGMMIYALDAFLRVEDVWVCPACYTMFHTHIYLAQDELN